MADKYRITYDSEKEDAFVIHLPNKTIQFERNENNLYIYRPSNATTDKQIQLLNIVEEDKIFCTHRQLERAKRARNLYHALGAPSIPEFKLCCTLTWLQPILSQQRIFCWQRTFLALILEL
jgi:hypothetical protein